MPDKKWQKVTIEDCKKCSYSDGKLKTCCPCENFLNRHLWDDTDERWIRCSEPKSVEDVILKLEPYTEPSIPIEMTLTILWEGWQTLEIKRGEEILFERASHEDLKEIADMIVGITSYKTEYGG